MTVLDLPWPPSVNHYWRRVGAKTLISEKGRAYREAVAWKMRLQRVGRIDGRLAVLIVASAGDARERDLDNLPKATLDSLQHAGVFRNDSAIDLLLVVRGELDRKRPHLAVTIRPITVAQGDGWGLPAGSIEELCTGLAGGLSVGVHG